MKTVGEKVIPFQKCVAQLQSKTANRQDGAYDCFMSGDRLKGACELLICERGTQKAEQFCLSFTPEGLTQHRYLSSRNERQKWLEENSYCSVTYQQALTLLGDAVRQNYRYKKGLDWINRDGSCHLQRIWMRGSAQTQELLQRLLSQKTARAIVQLYLSALSHKDAALLYDLQAKQLRQMETRELYIFNWHHALEDLEMFDYELMDQVQYGQESCGFFITVYGVLQHQKALSVDVSIRVGLEDGNLRIFRERVLEARCILGKCN